MNNYLVKIKSEVTKEVLTEYTLLEEKKSHAWFLGKGKFRREYPQFSDTRIIVEVEETKRNLIPIQDPQKWEFIND
jgi:hypothetical protein